jgi:hypothetical protein
MKFLIALVALSLSTMSFASDHDYDVTGEDENGITYEGVIHSTNGEREVSGEITDENGNEKDFSGQWDGNGKLSEEADDSSIELETNGISL